MASDAHRRSLDWAALRLLLAVAEAGSLRGAAERLTVSQPTLSRRLRDLEREAGVPLLVRHARGITLTEAGTLAVRTAAQIHEEVGDLARSLSGETTAVKGRVRLSCTEPVAAELIPASLAALRDAHPALAVDVVVDAHASDLDRREADLAIRMFQPRRASLIARRVGRAATAFYASRAYIDAHGTPEQLSDLAEHAVIGPDRDPLFTRAAAQLGFAPEQMRFRTDSLGTTLAWVRQGLAIGALLTSVADRDRDLVRLLEPVNAYPVWLVTHPDLWTSAAVRAVWDQLAADLPPLLA